MPHRKQHRAMNRAFDAMHQFVAGNEALLIAIARSDPEAIGFIRRLHPQYQIDWMRDRWPGEIVDPARELLDGRVHCCRLVGEIQDWIHVVLARDAACAAAAEAGSQRKS